MFDMEALGRTSEWSIAPLVVSRNIVFEVIGRLDTDVPFSAGEDASSRRASLDPESADPPPPPGGPRKVASRMVAAASDNCNSTNDYLANIYELVYTYEQQIKLLTAQLKGREKEWAEQTQREVRRDVGQGPECSIRWAGLRARSITAGDMCHMSRMTHVT